MQLKKTLILNSPQGLRNANEKYFINNFPEIIPDNIVTSDDELIREFLYDKKEIVIKPLNCCFSKGVFYLNDKDKNIHTIIDTATNSGKTMVMVQEFLPKITEGDKRLVYIDGEKQKNTKDLELEYGIHEIIVRADGYETLSRYISVGSAETDISFILDKIDHQIFWRVYEKQKS